MVTNPATRDWTVTASMYATLNEMYGNRTVCGIGRGDSAVRVTNGKPTTLATMAEATHVIRELANGRSVDYKGSTITLPVGDEVAARGVGRRLRPEGAQDDRRDLRRLHPPARRPADRRLDDQGRAERRRRRRPRPRRRHDLRRRAGLRRRRHRPTCATSAAGSAAWSATTSPTSSTRYGEQADRQPSRRRSPTTSRAARATTTTSTARPATPTPSSCPTRSSTGSASSARPTEHLRRLEELRELGVDQFAIYLQHDAQGRHAAGLRRAHPAPPERAHELAKS